MMLRITGYLTRYWPAFRVGRMDYSEKTKRVEYLDLPGMSLGSSRRITLFRYGQPGNRPMAYLQAGLHGNELPGLLVLHHLIRCLDAASNAHLIKGEIVVAPAVNPVGVSQFLNNELLGRFDFYGGNNFNRNFPDIVEKVAEKVGPLLTEKAEENRALIRAEALDVLAREEAAEECDYMRQNLFRLGLDADLAFDLHADGISLMHLYVHDKLRDQAEVLGTQMGVPVILLGVDRSARSFDDSLSMFWFDLAERFPEKPISPGCFAATIELRGRNEVSDHLASADAENLFRFLIRRGIIEGEAGVLPEPICEASIPLHWVDQGISPAAGVAVFHKSPGDWVSEGDIVADVVDPLNPDPIKGRYAVESRTEGLLFSQNLVRLVRPGQIFYKIAGKKPLNASGDVRLEP